MLELEEYLIAHTDPEPAYLAAINRTTHLKVLNPRMLSGHLQGRVLAMLSQMMQPRSILEIGTFTGYSALCLAEGLAAGGRIHTIEADDELEELIAANLQLSPFAGQVVVHIGDAKQLIPRIEEVFDLVFIDGDKREYQQYLELVLPKVRKGGIILADNTLWDGKVLVGQGSKDPQTAAIMEFNNRLSADERVDKVMLPLRDGLTMIRKR
ncbi:MAG: O-methyltransferase [Bacteroidales bacterium]|jgi:predicted O-methyltransferase YrrM|nr:O-methyltransferase [Bacteroidales bacterium]